jgi:hemolysin III
MNLSVITDGGPIYWETFLYLQARTNHWLVEPWNAGSAALFLVVALVWALCLRANLRLYPFILYGLAILAVGGVGGTLYHALRSQPIYLLMDWLPIVILTYSMAVWFLLRLTRKRWLALAYVAGGLALIFVGIMIVVLVFGAGTVAASVGYALLGVQAAGPITLYIIKTRYRDALWFWLALACFALAVVFRAADMEGWLPMGTHFLWHLFGAAMANFLIVYLWRVRTQHAGVYQAPQKEPV